MTTMTVTAKTNVTMKYEASFDGGATFVPVILRQPGPEGPPDTILPEGWHWCSIEEAGKPTRWVPMMDPASLS